MIKLSQIEKLTWLGFAVALYDIIIMGAYLLGGFAALGLFSRYMWVDNTKAFASLGLSILLMISGVAIFLKVTYPLNWYDKFCAVVLKE